MTVIRERKRRKKGTGRTPTVNVAITTEEKDLIQQIADAQGVKKSAVVRTALEGWLRRNKHLADKQPSDVES